MLFTSRAGYAIESTHLKSHSHKPVLKKVCPYSPHLNQTSIITDHTRLAKLQVIWAYLHPQKY